MTRRDFEQAAHHLAHKLSDTLGTAVFLIPGDRVAASSEDSESCCTDSLSVPFELLGERGWLLIQQPSDARLPSKLVQSIVTLLVEQASIARNMSTRLEMKNQFIHRLLTSPVVAEEGMLREGEILGLDLSRPRAVILIDASALLSRPGLHAVDIDGAELDDWLRVQSLIRHVVRFFSLPSDAICGYIGRGQIAVLKASSSRDLGPWVQQRDVPEEMATSWSNLQALKRAANGLLDALQTATESPISLGIGRYHSGVRGMPRSYEDARTALSIGQRLYGAGHLYSLDELGIPALVGTADEQTRLDLATHLLGPLDSEAELRETLDAFFEENCSVANTASRLFVHRNTLNYRLDKVSALTGLDPKRFDDAMLLRYAFILCRLSNAGP